jgi:hypothetical protein
MSEHTHTLLTLGDVARRLECPDWVIRRLIKKGLVPPPIRLGIWRVFHERDIPGIARAFKASGLGRTRRTPAHV